MKKKKCSKIMHKLFLSLDCGDFVPDDNYPLVYSTDLTDDEKIEGPCFMRFDEHAFVEIKLWESF